MSLSDEYAAVKKSGGVIDLASRVKLSFTGNDRIRYLNGQLTAKLTGTNGVQPACVTTAKGKLCADVFVGTWPAAVIVDAEAEVSATLLPRLEKYIVADDVVIEDVTDRAALIHCIGVDGAELEKLIGLPPAFPVNRLGTPGADFVIPKRDDLAPIWEKLTSRFPVISAELAELLRIEAGIPRWGFELDENTLPAEAGLDRTHVDFHKGCYIGQEVISRIKSVGHVNRSLHGFLSHNSQPLPQKARIFSPEAPEKDWGNITSSVFSIGLNQHIALGFLRRGAPESGLLAAREGMQESAVPILLQPLPFAR